MSNTELVKNYLHAIESGAPAELVASFFDEAVLYEEQPNKIYPQGQKRNKAEMLAGFERGRKLMAKQRYEIRSVIEHGDQVVVEVVWTGTLGQALGNWPIGQELRANSAMFLELKDGKIIRQRNYDCYPA